MTATPTTLLQEVTQYYLTSGDFNGTLVGQIQNPYDELLPRIQGLVQSGLLSINFGDRHPNPHINAFEPEPIEEQIEKITPKSLSQACLYPTAKHLATVVTPEGYVGRPFTLRLALGDPQLSFRAFDARVLEAYRNDPRYSYQTDGIDGSISIRDQFYQTNSMKESDEVLLQTFGFGYNKDMKRAVIVFLRYLSDLSPEHQQIWHSHLLDGDFHPHPDYWAVSMGNWPEKVSIFEAFVEELDQINQMAALMGRPALFRKTYTGADRPRNFSFLIRPTKHEYADFVLLLDKMQSDNINPDFFQGDIIMEREETRADGKLVVTPKGTIAALEEWMALKVRTSDPAPVAEVFATFRKVRKLRQKPAHAIDDNEFDEAYFTEQRNLIVDACAAVRTIRQLFANHPRARNHKVPDWLYKGEIRTY